MCVGAWLRATTLLIGPFVTYDGLPVLLGFWVDRKLYCTWAEILRLYQRHSDQRGEGSDEQLGSRKNSEKLIAINEVTRSLGGVSPPLVPP